MLEPHSLLTVTAGTSSGRPAACRARRPGFWPCPACSTLPDDDFLDLLGLQARPSHRFGDDDAAQLDGGDLGQGAQETADGGAAGAEDDGLTRQDGAPSFGWLTTTNLTSHTIGPSRPGVVKGGAAREAPD